MALIGVILGFGVVVLVVVGYDLLMKLAKKENETKSKKSKQNGK
jgi:hypothetical protein